MTEPRERVVRVDGAIALKLGDQIADPSDSRSSSYRTGTTGRGTLLTPRLGHVLPVGFSATLSTRETLRCT